MREATPGHVRETKRRIQRKKWRIRIRRRRCQRRNRQLWLSNRMMPSRRWKDWWASLRLLPLKIRTIAAVHVRPSSKTARKGGSTDNTWIAGVDLIGNSIRPDIYILIIDHFQGGLTPLPTIPLWPMARALAKLFEEVFKKIFTWFILWALK